MDEVPITGPEAKGKPRYLRVVVESQSAGEDGNSPAKVNVRVPLNLIRAGVKLTNLIPNRAKEQINGALRKEGIEFDIAQVNPENIEELIVHLSELTVDVDEAKNKVECFASR